MFAWLAAAWWAGCGGARRGCAVLPAPRAGLIGGVLLAAAYAAFSGWGVPRSARWACWRWWPAALVGSRWPWPQVWLLTWRGGAGGRSLGADAGGFLAELCRGGRAVCYRPGAGGARRRARGRLIPWRTSRGGHAGAHAADAAAVWPGLGGGGCWRMRWRFPGSRWWLRRCPCWVCCWAPLWDAAAGAVLALGWIEVAGAVAIRYHFNSLPRLGAGCRRFGWPLLAMRLPWSLRVLGVPLMLPVLLWQPHRPPRGPVRAAGGGHRPGQCRDRAHRRAYPGVRHRPRFQLRRATPASAC